MVPSQSLSLRPRTAPQTRVAPRLWGRVKLANFMDLREEDFRGFIRELENDPLFRRLTAVENPDERVFSRRRFPGTDISRHLFELNEETMAGESGPDISPVLAKWHELLPLIRDIGMEEFKRLFLHEEGGLDAGAAAKACGITPAQAGSIREMLSDLCLLDLAQPTPASPGPNAGPGNVKVAAVEPTPGQPGTFQIGYFSTQDARGSYFINYKKLYELERKGKFSPQEQRRLRTLLKNAELINTRQTALYRILKKLVASQTEYFKTRRDEDLRPLTQQMLAREMGVHRSTVHRAIERKCLQTPWGEVKPLKSFLVNRKLCAKNLIGKLAADAGAALSDEALRRLLAERYDIHLARRTVCAYRGERNAHP